MGLQEIELEGKIILDKKINKNIFAFNAVAEYEIEFQQESVNDFLKKTR